MIKGVCIVNIVHTIVLEDVRALAGSLIAVQVVILG